MMPAVPLPPLREVLARYEIGARRSLGQHFLLDLNVCRKIARAAGDLSAGSVIEIGPGPGGLTRALLESGAAHVIAIEKDCRCIAALGEIAVAYPGRLEIVEADAMEIGVAETGRPPRRLVANLPYNVSVPLVMGWLENADRFAGFTLMFQKEVADRLAAQPRTKDYGRVSVLAQWRSEVRPLFNLGKDNFTPPPKVASTVVSLTPRRPETPQPSWRAMDAVTRAAFAHRRKVLRGPLRTLGLDASAVGIDPAMRAEELSVRDFVALAAAYERRK
jgi:16S rRNA (adenine1518-N6/adenine1519-N6)-dimethyltransferase